MQTRKILFMLTAFSCMVVQAQPTILLEACNNIEEKSKRLTCLEELNKTSTNNQSLQKVASHQNLRRAFLQVQGMINSGISFKVYQETISEPIKALAIFKSENPDANASAIASLEKSNVAYKDAQTLWHANIYSSKDGGIFGRILPYEQLGLSWLISKYELQTTSILFNKHVPISEGLTKIWRVAEDYSKSAFNILDGKVAPDPGSSMGKNVEPNKKPTSNRCSEATLNELRKSGMDESNFSNVCGAQ